MPKYIMKFDGTDYRFLSNFYPFELKLSNLYLDKQNTLPLPYASVEHAFQATKTYDLGEREEIRTASTPGVTKRLGRRVALRDDWDVIKDNVMLDLLRKKFSDEHPELKKKLLDTGDAILVEGNTWHDNHFGVCTCIGCGSIGKNVLGTLLMKVRDEMQEEFAGRQADGDGLNEEMEWWNMK